jgi:carbon-monoxide dehydrogenase large subunit
VAQWSGASGELTLWNTTQNPHILRFLCSVVTGVPEDKLRVIAPEVGGGFGSKIAAYPADFLTVFCAMQLNRPVKWTETRSENYQATTHGRDQIQDVSKPRRRILGLRATSWWRWVRLSPLRRHSTSCTASAVWRIRIASEDVYGCQ